MGSELHATDRPGTEYSREGPLFRSQGIPFETSLIHGLRDGNAVADALVLRFATAARLVRFAGRLFWVLRGGGPSRWVLFLFFLGGPAPPDGGGGPTNREIKNARPYRVSFGYETLYTTRFSGFGTEQTKVYGESRVSSFSLIE